MSNGTRRRDRWQTMSDGEVLRDVAEFGLAFEDVREDFAARLRRIARDVDARDVGGSRCDRCGSCLHAGEEHDG
jgi:hypothetical protein